MRSDGFGVLVLSLFGTLHAAPVLAASSQAQESFPVIGTLELGEAPHQISFARDGKTAYVAAAGSDWVAVVDVESRRITAKLPVADTPLGVIAGPSGDLFATRFRADGIVQLRKGDGAVLGELTTGGAPSLFSPLPDDRFLVSVEKADRLWILDARKDELIRSYETGRRPFPPAATSDGRLAFVPDYDDGTVSVIDLWNERIHGPTRVGAKPSGGAVLPGDIDYVVALRGEDRLAFINTATFRVVDSLSEGIGDGPFSVVVAPNGRLAFVNNTASHDVSVLDVAARRVITKIPVGETPIAMAVHPSGETLWVASEGNDTVSIVRIDDAWRAEPEKPRGTAVTEVAVMGMIHGRHRVSQTWGLRQVRETIERFQPDVICPEIPPNRWERIWSDYSRRGVIEDSRVRRFPEYTDVVLPLTRTMDFEIVPCAAWTQEMSDLRETRSHQFQTDPKWAEAHREYEAQQAEIIARRPPVKRMEDPRFIHSDAYDALIKEELVGYDEVLNDWYGPGGWSNINEGHMHYINEAINEHPGQRILVTFGAGHKYWFLEKLRERADVRLVDLAPYLPEADVDIQNETGDACAPCRAEVLELHQFFEDWFTGKISRSDETFARFLGVLADDFEIISPEGRRSTREEIAEATIVANGRLAEQSFRIWIENFRARPSSDDTWIVTYEEWQEQDGEKKGRLSTAVFERDPSTVNGVRWQHVHETWIREP